MELSHLPTEVILTSPYQSLGDVTLEDNLQPGHYLEIDGKTYAVLERHHRYQFKAGRYHLRKIALYVQKAQRPTESTWLDGRWVVGDASCRFNARSEIIRCAVNPDGPCARCRYYEAL